MLRRLGNFLLALLLTLLVVVASERTSCSEESFSLTDFVARDQQEAIKAEPVSLLQQIEAPPTVGCDLFCDEKCSGKCDGACNGGCDSCGGGDDCQGGGFLAGADATVLVAHKGGLTIDLPSLGVSDFVVTPRYDVKVSPRVWFGYQAPNGLGVRGRYWQFDQGADRTSLPFVAGTDLSSSLEAETLDGEFFQTSAIADWVIEFAGGVRYAKIEDGLNVDSDGVEVSVFRDFEGFGPTASVAVRRPVGCRGLGLVGGFRASLLYGEDSVNYRENVLGLLDGLRVVSEDDLLEIFEIQVGAEWRRTLAGGSSLFARAVFEGQAWELSPLLFGTGDANIGFVGGSFGFGIDR